MHMARSQNKTNFTAIEYPANNYNNPVGPEAKIV